MKKQFTYLFCFISAVLCGLLLLQGCSTEVAAPCDNYGANCEPKIKINQWTPST